MRVIIVHSYEQVMSALEVAASVGCELVLQSAPDAIFYAGSLYLLQMFHHALLSFPDVKARFILDCADSHAEAIAAIQIGHRHLRSSAPAETYAKLADIAKQHGATITNEPFEFIDLLMEPSPQQALTRFLSSKA